MASGKRGGAETLVGGLLVVVLAVVWFLNGGSSPHRPAESHPAGSAATTAQPGRSGAVALSQLPPEARRTVQRIRHGGPFPYSQDGAVFENREGNLPPEPRGYYHEYTVTTPGSPDRGARRIVVGQQGELYYTADHYRSFKRIEATR
ncbi:MAG TPA: ribonuclease domain-containing protein [Marmoricola sp.]|nr:ribonuclease domain-containing protein [Marmoricola sp.]